MTTTELLHVYFDEGLDPEREEVLFSALAADAQLRREFAEHVRLHAFIQDDIRAVTTPAAITTALFTGLGIASTAAVSAATAGAHTAAHNIITQTAGTSARVLRKVMPHVFTSVVTVVLSSVLFFSYFPRAVEQRFHTSQTPILRAPESYEIAADNTTAPLPTHAGPESASAEAFRNFSASAPATATSEGNPQQTQELVHPEVFTFAIPNDVFTPVKVSFAGDPEYDAGDDVAAMDTDLGAAPDMALASNEQALFSSSLASDPPYLPWKAHFFAYNEGGSFLSNLVFEMRVLNSRSHPSVDLPYNSHDLFKDMAISAVYKVSDIHAFGLEYGRETFGQEFQSMTPSDEVAAREPIRVVYTPPAPWIPAVVQRNKMLDWYGAVWKLSLPQLGVMDFVYPYARTMLGATKQGPLAKMRFGLEMYPTNYSMFNLGLEGTLLNYSFEGSWYKTYKLGVTFGVAVGF